MKFANKVKAAQQFAAMCHDGQMYGELPYTCHLADVYHVLLRFDVTDKDVLAAGYLHDAVEDTEVPLDVIYALFGPMVADIVNAVTDAPGENRKVRKAATYPKIRAMGTSAILVKLADRIANLEHSHAAKNIRMWKMYQKEHQEFANQLREHPEAEPTDRGAVAAMWRHLDKLLLMPPQLPAPAPVSIEV